MSSGFNKKVKENLFERGLTFAKVCDILMAVKQTEPLAQPMTWRRFSF